MKEKENKRHLAYEALVMLGLLALLLFITRLWPILLLVILGIFVAMLRLLFLSSKKVEPVEPILALPAANVNHEPTEQDMQTMAYMIIQQRITQILEAKYPGVRWVWENARAKEDIIAGNKVYVLVNRAGGFRRGFVVIRNLHVYDVIFDAVTETAQAVQPAKESAAVNLPKSIPDASPEDDSEEIPEDFSMIAFQWVESHVIELNERVNEAIAQRKQDLLIPADELPVMDSWVEICKELERNDLTGATCCENGIVIEFEQ